MHTSVSSKDKSIVSLDPTTPFNPVPLIADILRTRYCVPGSVFLVERIELSVAVPSEGRGKRRRRERVVRLLLGDGELCIQALIRPEYHCFVDGGMVYEGGYVKLDRFELGVWEGDGKQGDGKVVYLVVGDMVTVGWNEGYMEVARREREREREVEMVKRREMVGEEAEEEGGRVGVDDGVDDGVDPEKGKEDMKGKDTIAEERRAEEEIQQAVEGAKQGSESTVTKALEAYLDHDPGAEVNPPSDTKAPAEPDYIFDTDDDAFETLQISPSRVSQRRVPISPPSPPGPQAPLQRLQAAIIKDNQNQPPKSISNPTQNTNKPRPFISNDPTQPLKLTPLRQIPHLPYKQNWMVNVLAIIVSLSSLEPSHISPYVQRTARLADPSTLKQVHLTVVLDPHDFTPQVGSVVLLLGVKNHMFDGGSLRKYVSDRPRNGTSWWLQHPEALGWCDGEVERLREWWRDGGGVREGG